MKGNISMYNMTFEEMILFAKIVAYVSGDKTIVLGNADKEMAYATLKKMVDRRIDMTEQQKEAFKSVVDLVKELDGNR